MNCEGITRSANDDGIVDVLCGRSCRQGQHDDEDAAGLAGLAAVLNCELCPGFS